ncbi:DUF6531 domain-containing protein [Pseudomonas sp. LABIM340]|uniref:DUF6531 domain-containing protein n=1 Tax=Pseudomonas sp. LABIM340 TaxID=3156585 RepID=UPI0032AF39C8
MHFAKHYLAISAALTFSLGAIQAQSAFGGSFSTMSGIAGGVVKGGFPTMESAAEWGWKYSLLYQQQASHGWRYGGVVYNKVDVDGSPPKTGRTNFWWGYKAPNGNTYHYYMINWSSTEPVETKDIGIIYCGAIQKSPSIGSHTQFSRGYSFQVESDIYSDRNSPKFTRIYNSSFAVAAGAFGENWHHNFEARIQKFPIASVRMVTVSRPDGKANIYTQVNGAWSSDADVKDILTSTYDSAGNESGWKLVLADEYRTDYFDVNGRLQSTQGPDGQTTKLAYNANQQIQTITSSTGQILSLNYDTSGRIKDITDPSGLKYKYEYDNQGRLAKFVRPDDSTKNYLFEKNALPFLITGIVDRGLRTFTATYDDLGRVTSSEQVNATQKISMIYNTDGSTTVINPYNKETTYRYQTILGVKRVIAIEGEASPNCPDSNSTFTYDAHGLLKTKTDAKGNVTTYDYNDRSLEISRTEASGTAQTRTITTEWHPTLFLKTKVTEPNRITTYQYDPQGRQTGQIVTPR